MAEAGFRLRLAYIPSDGTLDLSGVDARSRSFLAWHTVAVTTALVAEAAVRHRRGVNATLLVEFAEALRARLAPLATGGLRVTAGVLRAGNAPLVFVPVGRG